MSLTDNIRMMVLTPQETLFDGLVEKVDLPGTKGRFMVLKGHAPLISSLSEGNITFVSGGKEEKIRIQTGFVRINDNEVLVCAEI